MHKKLAKIGRVVPDYHGQTVAFGRLLLILLLTCLLNAAIHNVTVDVISFHNYASWFSPPYCGQNS